MWWQFVSYLDNEKGENEWFTLRDCFYGITLTGTIDFKMQEDDELTEE